MLLTMDVGNTNMGLGLWQGDTLLYDWRINTVAEMTGDELGLHVGALLNQHKVSFNKVNNLIICSVVPPMRPSLEKFAFRYLKVSPVFVEGHEQKLMQIKYDNPKEVGADRVVVSIAAYRRYKKALIVIDFGTATTFDCISEKGEYLGGAIAPGLKLSADALFQRAAKLPKIELFYMPEKIIAKNTVSSLNAGLVFGYISLVDGMVSRIKEEMETKPMVVATGGLATLIASNSKYIEKVLPDLTLEGLRIIFQEKAW